MVLDWVQSVDWGLESDQIHRRGAISVAIMWAMTFKDVHSIF